MVSAAVIGSLVTARVAEVADRNRYDSLVNRVARLSLVALGVAAALYGTASLTGGWMGERALCGTGFS